MYKKLQITNLTVYFLFFLQSLEMYVIFIEKYAQLAYNIMLSKDDFDKQTYIN